MYKASPGDKIVSVKLASFNNGNFFKSGFSTLIIVIFVDCFTVTNLKKRQIHFFQEQEAENIKILFDFEDKVLHM